MIECRYCREVFGTPLEKIGARCPMCRMPLFERDRPKPPPIDLGACALHPEKSAHGKCHRCGKLICAVCRTRWNEEVLCPVCLDRSLEREPNPRMRRMQNRQASWSLTFAILGWFLLLMAAAPLRSLPQGLSAKEAITAGLLFLTGLLPATWAVGQGTACIRSRGSRLALATWGVCLGAVQLGLSLGILIFNAWLN